MIEAIKKRVGIQIPSIESARAKAQRELRRIQPTNATTRKSSDYWARYELLAGDMQRRHIILAPMHMYHARLRRGATISDVEKAVGLGSRNDRQSGHLEVVQSSKRLQEVVRFTWRGKRKRKRII